MPLLCRHARYHRAAVHKIQVKETGYLDQIQCRLQVLLGQKPNPRDLKILLFWAFLRPAIGKTEATVQNGRNHSLLASIWVLDGDHLVLVSVISND